MKRLLFLFLLLLFFAIPSQVHADTSWIIENFNSDITIQQSGVIRVVETISVDFRNNPKPGIYRDIPYFYEVNGKQEYTNVSVTNVLQNNHPVQYIVSQMDGDKEVQIGDPNQAITGRNVYTIIYTVTGALSGLSDHDELYWNVTGNDWQVAIQKAEATVALPSQGVQQVICYQGTQTSQMPCQANIASSQVATFVTTSSLPNSEGLTIAVNFKKGLVPILTAYPPFPWISASLVLLLILFAGAYVFRKYRKQINLSKNVTIRAIRKNDKEWITDVLIENWKASIIVSRGKQHDATLLPGFIAVKGKKRVGLITYIVENKACEIITLNSLVQKHGIGTRLLKKVREVARRKKCKRLWLIETNDNTRALEFYQHRGFKIKKIYKNAIKTSRKRNPQIPLTGQNGIHINDEIELEIRF